MHVQFCSFMINCSMKLKKNEQSWTEYTISCRIKLVRHNGLSHSYYILRLGSAILSAQIVILRTKIIFYTIITNLSLIISHLFNSICPNLLILTSMHERKQLIHLYTNKEVWFTIFLFTFLFLFVGFPKLSHHCQTSICTQNNVITTGGKQ